MFFSVNVFTWKRDILYFAGHKVGFVWGDIFSGKNFLTLVNIVLLQIINQWEKTKLNLQF